MLSPTQISEFIDARPVLSKSPIQDGDVLPIKVEEILRNYSREKIKKVEDAIGMATELMQRKFPGAAISKLAESPLFAILVKHFLEDEAETKQLLND